MQIRAGWAILLFLPWQFAAAATHRQLTQSTAAAPSPGTGQSITQDLLDVLAKNQSIGALQQRQLSHRAWPSAAVTSSP